MACLYADVEVAGRIEETCVHDSYQPALVGEDRGAACTVIDVEIMPELDGPPCLGYVSGLFLGFHSLFRGPDYQGFREADRIDFLAFDNSGVYVFKVYDVSGAFRQMLGVQLDKAEVYLVRPGVPQDGARQEIVY